jgi:hypothetical protein
MGFPSELRTTPRSEPVVMLWAPATIGNATVQMAARARLGDRSVRGSRVINAPPGPLGWSVMSERIVQAAAVVPAHAGKVSACGERGIANRGKIIARNGL